MGERHSVALARTTEEDIQRRLIELESKPHRLAWKRIERAILITEGSPDDRAAAVVDIHAILAPLPVDVRGSLAREAERLAREHGIDMRAKEVMRAIANAERAASSPSRNGGPLQGQAATFAPVEPWPEPVDGAELAAEITRSYTRFVALPPGAATAQALWTIHAHAHDASDVSPILAASSPEKRCGKTTALTVAGALVPRPLSTANITAAALFRAIEKVKPTLLIDEADTFLTSHDELRGVLNSGHLRAGAYVIRTVGDDHEARLFRTWCPKMIALIGRLPLTLEDRSIVIPMRRRKGSEQIERLRLDRLHELEPLRRQAARWAADHYDKLKLADPEVPDELGDREADNWRPLLAIADAIGGAWPERARKAALALSRADDDESAGVELLMDIQGLYDGRAVDRLFSQDIAEELAKMEHRRWPEWGRQAKPITPAAIARLLKPFGVKPATLRIGDDRAKGYAKTDFADAFDRYLPHPNRDTVTNQQSQGVSAKPNRDIDPACHGCESPKGGATEGMSRCHALEGAGEDKSAGDGAASVVGYLNEAHGLDLVAEDRPTFDPAGGQSRVQALAEGRS